jgi:hypothetical protein
MRVTPDAWKLLVGVGTTWLSVQYCETGTLSAAGLLWPNRSLCTMVTVVLDVEVLVAQPGL